MQPTTAGKLLAIAFCSIVSSTLAQPRPVDYVNPLIGTAPLADKEYLGGNPVPGEELYTGTVNPGAMVPDPNGYVCAGPVTGFDGGYHVRGSGYRFEDTSIMGFTQLNGEYSDQNKLLFMPTTGPLKTAPGSRDDPSSGYRSIKDAATEKASPGYYSVSLSTYGIKVELTATANCGFQRYTFPRAEQANVLIDLANCQSRASGAEARILDQRTIEGSQTSGKQTVYFRAVFNKDFSAAGTWKNGEVTPGSASVSGLPAGAYATFKAVDNEAILVKVGTSTRSLAEAASQLAGEVPGWDFDAVRHQTESLWSAILDRFAIDGGSEGDRTNFYTAIYRMAAGPHYSWFPGNDAGTMILARGADWTAQKTAAVRPQWGGGYWGPGNVSGLVGLYKMGFQQFDVKGAYATLREMAMNGGKTAGELYRKYGYIPADCGVADYVNRSIGYADEDHALAELAKIVGEEADERFFRERSKNYAKLFNASEGFLCPRRADGSWVVPLDPVEPHAEDMYREGNAWNYLWFNTGDIPGLIDLLGGPGKFSQKLDTFFSANYQPKTALRDLTGVIGLYFHGNEQYRHIPYLYNYVSEPWKTQALVRKIQKVLYRPVPAGMCGMDDFGAQEGWYAASALGFGTVDRASGWYEIGSPLFPKVTIKLDGAKPGSFVIQANNVSDTNLYIQSAALNGKPLDVPQFRHGDITAGGSLVFEMGPQPNKQWGLGPRAR